MSKLKEYIQKELELQNKKRLTGEDEVDIFEGGPAGQVLKDIDPLTGGIQLEEDDLFGDQTFRNVTGFTSALLQDMVPKEKELDLQQQRAQQQAIYDQLLQVTGLQADSFEGQRLLALLKGNKEFAEKMGFNRDIGTTDSPRFGLYDFGNFILGPARDGLTTMTETGASIKDLPFEQKLGIFFLPIDALDVIGIGALARGGLRSILKAGVKKYGKDSKLTLKNIVDDKELMDDVIKNNPEVEDFLQEFGFDSVGAARTPKSLIDKMKKDPSKEAIGPVGTKPKTEIDIEAESIRQATKAAEEAQTKLNNFVEEYNKIFSGKPGNRARNLRNFAARTGEQEYNRLFALAEKQNLLMKGPGSGGARRNIFSGEAADFVKKNINLSNEDLAKALNQNPEKYFVKGTEVTPEQVQNFIETQGIKSPEGGRPLSTDKRTKTKVEKINTIYDEMMESDAYDINNQGDKTEAFIKSFRQAEGKTDESIFTQSKISESLKRSIKQYNKLNPNDPILTPRELADLRIETARREFDTSNVFETYLRNDERLQKLIDDGFLDQNNKESMVRFINFIRRSDPEFRGRKQTITNPNIFNKFLDKKFSELANDLSNKDSIFYKNFSEFVKVDEIRKTLSPTKQMLKNKSREFLNIKPFLNRIFLAPANKIDNVGRLIKSRNYLEQIEDANNSVNIAHRFEGAEIGKTVSEDLAGAFELPSSYNLDLSIINSVIQPSLERRARRAIKAGDTEELQLINKEATDVGTEFVIDNRKFGKQLSLQEKLQSLVAPYMSESGKRLQKEHNITNEMIEDVLDAIDLLEEASTQIRGAPQNLQTGGLVGDVDDIFEEEDEIMKAKKSIFPRISVEFGDAARGTMRPLKEDEALDTVDLPLSAVQFEGGPEVRAEDVQPTENIFTGEMEQANLKLPFWKLFTKPPVNETAPIPTPKEGLDNPTKKQKESLELEKEKKKDDVFDPTPEDNAKVDLGSSTDVAVTPKTGQAVTGVFYSDIERVLARPDTPEIFLNKKALLDFFRKNRIRDSEFRDYQIESLLRIYDENTPIPKQQVIEHLRQSPIRGMHVHATGQGSEIINPYGAKDTRYTGYAEPGFISGSQRERVLYIPSDKIAGDSGVYPQSIFEGESVQRHEFGIPDQDNAYIVGWSRLTDRNAILPTKISAPKTQSKVPGLTRERERIQRQLAGLFAEGQNKLNAQAQRRGIPVDEIQAGSLEEMLSTYSGTLDEISPGLVDQIDELIVKARDLDAEIAKGSNVDTSGIVKVAFADEIQSDIMQAAAGRKQKLVATLRKIQDEGRDSTTLPQLSRVGQQALEFFEENKSVFRPLRRTQAEVDIIGERLGKLDAEVDEIINRYIETRELDPASVTRLKEALTENINQMINDLIVIDSKTYDGLFPDIPFKKREEWADALIKKDLFELAYQKFVLKDPNAPDYYSVTPDQFVIDRYSFKGNSATPMDVRAADKKAQIDYFTARGEFRGSEYKGIGMSEFYGGPNAKSPDGKHYTSVIEKILKTQAKSNNSEFTVLNVQTKEGSKDVFRITDQNGNMVATLSNRGQAERVVDSNPNYRIQTIRVPDQKSTTPSFAIKITEEMLEPYKTHKAKGGLVQMIDIFEVA